MKKIIAKTLIVSFILYGWYGIYTHHRMAGLLGSLLIFIGVIIMAWAVWVVVND